MGLTGYLECGVEISQVTEGRLDVQLFPQESLFEFRPKLLFVPGHYDALYQ